MIAAFICLMSKHILISAFALGTMKSGFTQGVAPSTFSIMSMLSSSFIFFSTASLSQLFLLSVLNCLMFYTFLQNYLSHCISCMIFHVRGLHLSQNDLSVRICNMFYPNMFLFYYFAYVFSDLSLLFLDTRLTVSKPFFSEKSQMMSQNDE